MKIKSIFIGSITLASIGWIACTMTPLDRYPALTATVLIFSIIIAIVTTFYIIIKLIKRIKLKSASRYFYSKINSKSSIHLRNSFSKADELRKWHQLYDDGIVSKEEYQRAREELLN